MKLNGREILLLNLNNEQHFSKLNMKLTDEISILFYAGLESERDATLKITHQNSNGDDVEDAKLHLVLDNGNQISTTAVWRKGMLSDVHKYLQRKISESDISSVDHFLEDVEIVMSIIERASIQILDDLFYFTEIDLANIFIHVQEVSQSVIDHIGMIQHVNKQLLDYLMQPKIFIVQFR